MRRMVKNNKNKNKVIIFITSLFAMLITTCGISIAIFMPYIVIYYAPIWILSQIYLCLIIWCTISDMLPGDNKKNNKPNKNKSKIRIL